jgi:hypothetical protein
MGPIRAILLPGSVPPAQPAYGALMENASDDRLPVFLRTYVQGEQTPEPGAPCTGGVMG